MPIYPFLSPEWIDAARTLHAAHATDAQAPEQPMRMNLTVEGVPNSEVVRAHVDTTAGVLEIELGHLDSADVSVTLDYETAHAVLIDNNAEAAMGAFMAGRVRVEGDMTKLLAYQAAPPTAAQLEMSEELRKITAV